MYGPVYLSREFSAKFLPVLEAYYQIPGTEQFYWEQPYVDMLKGEAKRRLEKEDKELLQQTEEACGIIRTTRHWSWFPGFSSFRSLRFMTSAA